MKRNMYLLVIFLLGIVSTLNSCSAKIEVPAKVLKSFQSKFPDVSKVEWSKESDKEYEAEFSKAGDEVSANFSEDGKWIETEIEVTQESLPAAVRDVLNLDYAGYKKGEIAYTETAQNEQFYEIELKKGKEETIIHVTADGSISKIESAEDEDEIEEKERGKN